MKWKAMLALFDGVLAVAFIALFFMPLMALGPDFFALFWRRNWPVALAFLAVLAGVNAWFIANRRLIGLLSAGDWKGLAAELEERVFRRPLFLPLHVGLLANAYLALSNTDALLALEAFLAGCRPRLVGRFALAFGIPRLVGGDASAAEAHFAGLLGRGDLRDRPWVQWNRAFCLVQLGRTAEARVELEPLGAARADPVLAMLSLYLLEVCTSGDAAARRSVEEGRVRLAARVPADRMRQIVEEGTGNVEVTMLSRLVGDARQWLYGGAPP